MNYIRGIKLRERPHESSYLNDIPAVQYLEKQKCLDFNQTVTFFVGENGTGKSTLLEAIAIAMGFNPEGGSKDHMFSTKDSHSGLWDLITPIKTFLPKDGYFLRAEGFYNMSSYLDTHSNMLRYGGVSFHKQSHGEAFMALVSNRFEGNGIYILDEPESALSPLRLMSLMAEMDRLVNAEHSQFIIATHSPVLMMFPNAEILYFFDSGIERTDYRDTDHYRITKQFLENPDKMFRYLFCSED